MTGQNNDAPGESFAAMSAAPKKPELPPHDPAVARLRPDMLKNGEQLPLLGSPPFSKKLTPSELEL
jgi:hypothetical protein